MSWETLVTGAFLFKKGTPKRKQDEIISVLEKELECKIKWSDDLRCFEFEDVNWLSHVSGDRIKRIVERYKKFFDSFELSLFYLDTPDEWVVIEDDGEVRGRVILEDGRS